MVNHIQNIILTVGWDFGGWGVALTPCLLDWNRTLNPWLLPYVRTESSKELSIHFQHSLNPRTFYSKTFPME